MAEGHVGLGEVPPSNCQQFIDKGDWTRELSGLRGQSIFDFALVPQCGHGAAKPDRVIHSKKLLICQQNPRALVG